MLKCMGRGSAASDRAPSGTSCMRIATSPARASGGARSAAAAASMGTTFGIQSFYP